MAAFLSHLDVRVLADDGARPMLLLLQPLHYRSDRYGPDIAVPEGFIFDGASIPQLAMSITGWPGLRAACVHDWLLQQITDGAVELTREDADWIFGEALDACGVPIITAHLMLRAVQLFTQELRRQQIELAAGDSPHTGA